MLGAVVSQLDAGPSILPEDPRGYTPMHYFYQLFFHVEPGVASQSQILTIRDNFAHLQRALGSATTECVSADHPDCHSGEMEHGAFAPIGMASQPRISLCPAFFGQDLQRQAVTFVHELAHARLGVEHAGGRFLQFYCGETPVRNFDEAIDNAYVYDLFAACLESAASMWQRAAAQPGGGTPRP